MDSRGTFLRRSFALASFVLIARGVKQVVVATRSDRLSNVAGVPVFSDSSISHVGQYEWHKISLRPLIVGRLGLNNVQRGTSTLRIAVAVFILAHEMGHHYFRRVPYDAQHEDRANEYASDNYLRVAKLLGASPERIRKLVLALPWSVRQ